MTVRVYVKSGTLHHQELCRQKNYAVATILYRQNYAVPFKNYTAYLLLPKKLSPSFPLSLSLPHIHIVALLLDSSSKPNNYLFLIQIEIMCFVLIY